MEAEAQIQDGPRSSHVYTLVCYRPEGAEFRRSCLVSRTGSSHRIDVFLTAQEAAAAWADRRLEDSFADDATGAWEITLLLDGRSGDSLPSGDRVDFEEAHDTVSEKAAAIHARLLAERKACVASEKEAARERASKDAEAKDRADYERLRAVFGA